jgi:predicted nuclease with TOPRIM domain
MNTNQNNNEGSDKVTDIILDQLKNIQCKLDKLNDKVNNIEVNNAKMQECLKLDNDKIEEITRITNDLSVSKKVILAIGGVVSFVVSIASNLLGFK